MSKFFFILFILASFSSCDESVLNEHNETKKVIINQPIRDAHSYSNTNEIYTKHLHLDLEVDFETKTIYGIARHEMVNHHSDTAIFDIKGLEIHRVTIGSKNHEENTDYVIGIEDKILGAPLSVAVDTNSTFINIYYKTTQNSTAIDWLNPNLTSGKKHPLLYTQGQAILTRTWIPIQDSPANKFTYSADIKVDKDLLPLMSASNPKEKNETGEYHFEMKQPIPAYLIALTVGDYSYKKLSKNSGVYSEPSLIDAAAWEFYNLNQMIYAAENLYGSYLWEQYDIVVLPYSFPYGGMENPRLTFANPTIIIGDRSLVSVIAHELAHAWSGNLVTNATWDDFWLNEGFTVYFENRIMESIYGKEVADILAIVEFQELESEVTELLKSEYPQDTYLKLSLNGRNPNDGLTTVAYIKGAFLLKTIEQEVGRVKFDKFIKAYFKKFKFKALTTENFENFINKKLFTPNKINFDLKPWLYGKGIPANCIKIESERLNKMKLLANDFTKGKKIFKVKRRKPPITFERYTTHEWLAFIRELPRNTLPEQLLELDKKLNFRSCGNPEIMTEWFVLGIEAGYDILQPNIEKYLCKIGRIKYIEPIYKALVARENLTDFTNKTYKKAKKYYHPICIEEIDHILNLKN